MMSQNNSNETIAIQKARGIIEKINAVEEFDPTPLAVDYTDLKTGETMKRLPVMIQIAWFKQNCRSGNERKGVFCCKGENICKL